MCHSLSLHWNHNGMVRLTCSGEFSKNTKPSQIPILKNPHTFPLLSSICSLSLRLVAFLGHSDRIALLVMLFIPVTGPSARPWCIRDGAGIKEACSIDDFSVRDFVCGLCGRRIASSSLPRPYSFNSSMKLCGARDTTGGRALARRGNRIYPLIPKNPIKMTEKL